MDHGGMRVGAGRPGRHQKVESLRSIDVRRFQRDGLIDRHYVGPWSWRDPITKKVNAAIQTSFRENMLVLRFTVGGESVVQRIPLERTECHFGGTRPWFRCPGCNNRVAILFMHRRHFACRTCHDLVYASQSEDLLNRAWRMQDKIEEKLGPSHERPRGMHARTTRRRRCAPVRRRRSRPDVPAGPSRGSRARRPPARCRRATNTGCGSPRRTSGGDRR